MIIRGRCLERIKDVDSVGAIGVDHEAIKAESWRMLGEVVTSETLSRWQVLRKRIYVPKHIPMEAYTETLASN